MLLVSISPQVYPEGTHLMIPWIERPIIYDVRARPNLVESTSGSRDLQMVNFVPDTRITRQSLWFVVNVPYGSM